MHKIFLFIFLFIVIQNVAEAQTPGPVAKRPLNVVLILTDDQGAHLSTLGTKGIATPQIDALAWEGMLFTNAFAVVPSCSPSRSSIMTGMYPHANGHWRNTITPTLAEGDEQFGRASKTVDQVSIHEYIQTLPEVLQARGYFTAITQKFHMSPPWKFPYNARSEVQRDPAEYRKEISCFIAEAGTKPFFFQANIAPPHRNFDEHMEKFSSYLPPIDSIAVPPYLPDTRAMRQDVQKYFGSVQLADACAGAIVDVLREQGLLEHTLVIFTSDQGAPYHRAKASVYYAGLHVPYIIRGPGVPARQVSDALISHIDIMPTILDFLGIEPPQTVQGTSIKPLLQERAAQNKGYVFGQHNSHGPARAEHYPSRMVSDGRYYYILNLMPEKDYELPADLREEKGWGNGSYHATLAAKESHPLQYTLLKQLESGRPAEELYDTANDPGQLHNLAAQKEYEQKKAELKKVLLQWRKKTGDRADDPLEIPTRQVQN